MLSAAILLLAVLLPAGMAGAEDFWDRKLPDPPADFVFGYGSLINTASRDATAGHRTTAIPARVGAGFGFLRCWCDRSATGFTALGLRRTEPGETATTINGVLYPVVGKEMSDFDSREGGYARIEIPRDQIQAASWQPLPESGRIWVYVPVTPGHPPGTDLLAPSTDFPLLQSYIDVVLEGGLEYGAEYAREILATTTGWNEYWLNDREMPRRPWVFDKQAAATDKLLAAAVPHFTDRLLPEEYAAKRIGGR